MDLKIRGENFVVAHAELAIPERFSYLNEVKDTEESFNRYENDNMMFIGHTHYPGAFAKNSLYGSIGSMGAQDFQAQPNMRYIVNVGSVGDPRDDDPRASYVLYDSDIQRVIFRKVNFDIEEYRRNLQRSRLPIKPYFLMHYDNEVTKSPNMEMKVISAEELKSRQKPRENDGDEIRVIKLTKKKGEVFKHTTGNEIKRVKLGRPIKRSHDSQKLFASHTPTSSGMLPPIDVNDPIVEQTRQMQPPGPSLIINSPAHSSKQHLDAMSSQLNEPINFPGPQPAPKHPSTKKKPPLGAAKKPGHTSKSSKKPGQSSKKRAHATQAQAQKRRKSKTRTGDKSVSVSSLKQAPKEEKTKRSGLAVFLTFLIVVLLAAAGYLFYLYSKAHWHSLEHISVSSSSKAKFTLESNQSFYVTGTVTDNDVYTITYKTNLSEISEFKIELLSHNDLLNGMGRGESGEIAISEVEIFTGETKHKITSAEHIKSGSDIENSIDDNAETSWTVNGKLDKNEEGIFKLETPIKGGEGTEITINI